jgi:hypothetical protein
LRIFLGFIIKISFFLREQRLSRSFCSAVAFFVHQSGLVTQFQLLLYTALRCDAERVYYVILRESVLLAGQPSALSVVTLHENQRLKVQSACSDVSSEDYSKYVKYYISFIYRQNTCLGINKTFLFVTLKYLPFRGHLQEGNLTNFKENNEVWHHLVIHIIYDLYGNILKL